MKKALIITTLLLVALIAVNVLAQDKVFQIRSQTPASETKIVKEPATIDGIVKWEEIFDTTVQPTDWQVIDNDGSGTAWEFRQLIAFTSGDTVNPEAGQSFWFSNFNNANGSGLIDEWLITPRLPMIEAGDSLHFYAGAIGGSYDDSLRVWVSTTDSLPGSFTNLVDYFKVDGPTGSWYRYSFDMTPYAGSEIFVAVNYYIVDGGPAGTHSDNIWVDHFILEGQGQVQADKLLISEFVVTPTDGEFVEIFNPTMNPVDLTDYYLTDATFASGNTYYYQIVEGGGGGGAFGDFHARFPAGATIAPGEFQTIAMNGSGFITQYGVQPTYELYETDPTIPDMLEAFSGSINGQGGLTNSDEVIILYQWDGMSDLVGDVDYVIYDDGGSVPNEAVDKTGVSIDGPDPGTDSTTYLNDTAIPSQVPAPSHNFGYSVHRIDYTEGTQVTTGGNGVTGADETSENLDVTFTDYSLPSPNAAYQTLGTDVTVAAQIGGDSQYRSFWVNGSWDANGVYDPNWSGPLLELNDMGTGADLVAGDSIFTGSVFLVIDSTNTYNWWCGSENDVNSFLEDGTGFTVLNIGNVFTDTLIVDGDNGINEWVIALPGDFNGFNNSNDMTRNGTEWSITETLPAGNNEYKFAVMHQWNAAYGNGGIGGGFGNYTFNAPFAGDYLFTFDDADNSHTVMPVNAAKLQVIHNAADPAADSVDVYVNGALAIPDFKFRSATPYIDLPAGVALDIGVAPGNSTSVGDTLKNFRVTLQNNVAYVAVANGVLNPASFAPNPDGLDIAFTIFVRDSARMVATGSDVEFFAVHGATDAPYVDIIAQGAGTLLDNVPYGGVSDYLAVPPAAYTIDIADSTGGTVVASFDVDLSGLGGGTAAVIASGFLDPTANQNGAAFALLGVLADGTVVEFPAAGISLNPPLNLVATVEGPTQVDLVWDPPVPTGGTEIAYDDGTAEGSISIGATAAGDLAVRFTPNVYPSTLLAIKAYFVTSTDPAAMGDGNYTIWDGNNLGPGASLTTGSHPLNRGGFDQIDISSAGIQINANDFFISYSEPLDSVLSLAWDTGQPSADRSWVNAPGLGLPWQTSGTIGPNFDNDYMIRAIVQEGSGENARIVELAPAPNNKTHTIDRFKQHVPQSAYPLYSDVTLDGSVISNAAAKPGKLSLLDLAETIPSFSIDGLTGFNIYRSDDSTAFSVIGSVDSLTYSYSDSTVMGGEDYWYYITAVYTEGESDPSNVVSAVTPVGVYSFFDDFDSYTAGTQLVVQNPTDWTTWSGTAGGADDPFVSDAQAFSGSNSVVIAQNNDLVKMHGDQTSGVWEISFMVYIPSGQAGYFNTMSQFVLPGTFEWGMECYFDAGGAGRVFGGSATAVNFSYTVDTWQEVIVMVDLDNDWTQFYLGGVMIHEWQWTLGASGGGAILQLAANDFFGATANDQMYFDDYEIAEVQEGFFDDFEAYTAGTQLVVQNSTDWTTWSNNPGSAEDPFVVDAQAFSGSNSVNITGTNDLVYPIPDLTEGEYRISFYLYVPTGADAYFNTLQDFAGASSQWGMQVYFGEGGAGAGSVDAGAAAAATFTFNYDTWIYNEVVVDLNSDFAAYFIDGTPIVSWVWSTGTFGTGTLNQLGGSNFFAWDTGIYGNPDFFIDDYNFVRTDSVVAIPGGGTVNTQIPEEYSLHQNYPNPFNPTTTINYDLKQTSDVTLKIYNILGQEVRTLINARQEAGYKSVVWDGLNNYGIRAASGVYIYRIEAAGFVQSKKMILMK